MLTLRGRGGTVNIRGDVKGACVVCPMGDRRPWEQKCYRRLIENDHFSELIYNSVCDFFLSILVRLRVFSKRLLRDIFFSVISGLSAKNSVNSQN